MRRKNSEKSAHHNGRNSDKSLGNILNIDVAGVKFQQMILLPGDS
jgi:hypothetical protein